jgi:O-antigen/teichoic acid export membrane protein
MCEIKGWQFEMSLLRTTVRNVGYIYISMGVIKILTFISTIVLARLLQPSDFGIYALAAFVAGIVAQFSDFGIGSALIQRKDKIEEAANAAFYMYLAIGIILYSILFFVAPFGAQFFNESVLTQIIWIIGL